MSVLEKQEIHTLNYKTEIKYGPEYSFLSLEKECKDFAYAFNKLLDFAENNQPILSVRVPDYIGGDDISESRIVNFCPFCGAKIVYVEKDRVEYEQKEVFKTSRLTEWVKKL